MDCDTVFPRGTNLFQILPNNKPIIKNNNFIAYLQLLDNNIYIPFDSNNQCLDSTNGNDNVYIYGTVILHCLKNCNNIQSIDLNLIGNMELYWPEGLLLLNNNNNNNKDNKKKLYHEDFDFVNIDYNLFNRSSSASKNKKNNSTPNLKDYISHDNNKNSSRRYSDSQLNQKKNIQNKHFEKGQKYYFAFQFILPNASLTLWDSIKTDYANCKYLLTLSIKLNDNKYNKYNNRKLISINNNIFKGNLPVNFIHIPTDLILDDFESINIANNWRDSLFYEINVKNKNILLDGYLPIQIHLLPLDKKISLQKITIYLEEKFIFISNLNPKIHRNTNKKQYVLLQHSLGKLKKNNNNNSKRQNLLISSYDNDNDNDNTIEDKLFNYQIFVPYCFNSYKKLYPNQIYNPNLKILHWLKFELNVIHQGKNYDIIIDTPINVLNKMCSFANLLLPNYNDLFNDNKQSKSKSKSKSKSPPRSHSSNRFFPKEIFQSENTLSKNLSPKDIILPSIVINKNQNRIKNNIVDSKRYSPPLINSSTLNFNIYQPTSLSYDLVASQATSDYTTDTLMAPPSYDDLFQGNSKYNEKTIEIHNHLNNFNFNQKMDLSEQDLTTFNHMDSWFPKSLIK